jgi:hypothetical protein
MKELDKKNSHTKKETIFDEEGFSINGSHRDSITESIDDSEEENGNV